MVTSKLQTRTSRVLSRLFGGYTIRENLKPNWLEHPSGARLELDFLIEELDSAIEVQGDQHYVYVPHFHKSYDGFLKRLEFDDWKRRVCPAFGIELIEIAPEDDLNEAIRYLIEKDDRPTADMIKWKVEDELEQIVIGKNSSRIQRNRFERCLISLANAIRKMENRDPSVDRYRLLVSLVRGIAKYYKANRPLEDDEYALIYHGLRAVGIEEERLGDDRAVSKVKSNIAV